MGDPWIREFDRLTRLADEISADINERTRLQKNGEDVGRLNYKVQNKIGTLSSDLAALQNALIPDHRLPQKDFKNRQEMLQSLSNRAEQLKSFGGVKTSTSNHSEERDQLFERKGRAWGVPQETEDTKGKTNKGVVQLQNEIMEAQDKSLDFLSESITRQKDIARDINDELDVHTRLLDHMDPKVERTTIGVARETHRVMSFSDKAATGFLWCVILLLVVCIIILAAL